MPRALAALGQVHSGLYTSKFGTAKKMLHVSYNRCRGLCTSPLGCDVFLLWPTEHGINQLQECKRLKALRA